MTAASLTIDGRLDAVPRARRLVEEFPGLSEPVRVDARLVVSELVTNACLHGEPPIEVRLVVADGSLRVEVRDAGRGMPVQPRFNAEAMTGRGFALIGAVARRWGVEPLPGTGKAVWAELSDRAGAAGAAGIPVDREALLAMPDDGSDEQASADDPHYLIQLGSVPTALLLEAKSHIDDVVRELKLMVAEDGGESLPVALQRLVAAVTEDFAEARRAIKRQALQAAAAGDVVTDLRLRLPLSAAAAGERYLAALDEIDRHSRTAQLLTLAPPASHRAFRRWYLRALIDQLRARGRGEPAPPVRPFSQVLAGLLDELSAPTDARSRPETQQGSAPPVRDEAAQRLALELAVTAGGVGTFDWDLITGELLWDEQLFDIFGFADDKRGTLSIDDFFEAVHPGDRERVGNLLQRAVDEVGEYDAEYRIRLADSTTRWVLARGKALAGPDGTTARLLGAAQDTTVRRETEARISRVMDSLSTAFFFIDREWRFSFLNAEAERVLDRRRDDLLGRAIWDEFPAAIGSDFETYYRHAASSGEPVAFDAYYPEPLNAWYEVRAWPNPDGLAVYFIDVTDRRAAHDEAQRAISRAGLLARVTEELAETLDADTAMQRLAELVVPALADWCVVTLIEDDRQVGSRRGLGRSLGWHSDPGLRPVAQRYAVSRLAAMTDHALIVRAVETAVPQLHNTDAMSVLRDMFEPGAEPLRLLEELDTEAIAVLPLIGQAAPIGMLSVVNGTARGSFAPEDIQLLRELAARAGLVLDRGRLYRQQREVAEGLQRSLLASPQQRPGRQIAVRYVPAAEVAQVGGDWYDALDHPDGATVLVIGDVMGHDLLAAAAMGEVRMLIRTLAAQSAGNPAQTLAEAERVMKLIQLDTLATVILGWLEPAVPERPTRRFRFCNAGHPPPVVVTPAGDVRLLTSGDPSPLLGVSASPRNDEYVDLEPGSTVVLYTDGLVERRDESIDEGIARLTKVLAATAGTEPESLCDAVLGELMPERPEDDVALLAVRI